MGMLDAVPDSTVLPKCDLLCKIANIKKTKSKSGKLMFKAEFRIEDDGAGGHVNLPIWEQYLIGNDKDPDGENPKTWIEAPGARNMKRLFKKLSLDTRKDVDDLCAEAEGQPIGLSINRYVEADKKKDGTDNEYAGQPRNRVANYWTPGEKTPQIFEEEEVASAEEEAAAPAAKAAATKAATAPKAAAPKTAAAPKAAAPAAAVVVEEDEVVAPVAAKKPANGAATAEDGSNEPAQPAAAATAAKAPAEKVLACPECHEPFPKSQLGAHVAEAH